MKTKIIFLIALAAILFSFTLTSRNANHFKTPGNKNPAEQPLVNKGLAMEDKNQFN